MGNILFTLICGLFAWLATLRGIYRFLRVGRKSFFRVKPRETPPPCLLDPVLGRHGYVKLKDVKLHYVSNGDPQKPLMVLLHGFPEFWFSWRYQLKEFSREYCVVAVDLRGFGDSDKPPKVEDYLVPRMVEDIYQLIKHFTKENSKAVIMAHDWGGFIGYNLAAKYPEVVHKLIVGNAPHPKAFAKALKSSWNQFFKSWYQFYFVTPYLPEILLRSEDLGFLNVAFRNGQERVISKEEMEAYKYIYSRPGAFTPGLNYYRANMKMPSSGGIKDALQVSVPTLLIWGDKDVALSMLSATQSSRYVDKFYLRIIQGGSHWIQMHKPEEFNAHAWSFLKMQ